MSWMRFGEGHSFEGNGRRDVDLRNANTVVSVLLVF